MIHLNIDSVINCSSNAYSVILLLITVAEGACDGSKIAGGYLLNVLHRASSDN